MREISTLGPWIRRFLLEHLVNERNLAENTRRSYRDTMCQLLPFVSARLHKAADRLTVVEVSPKLIRDFLSSIETHRGCGIATRNQRLAAIHALARFVGEHSPEHIAWCAQVRCVPYKKGAHAAVPFLDKVEIDALLAAPDRRTEQGRRDYALLLFLYNTGARASEAADLLIGDLHLDQASRFSGRDANVANVLYGPRRCARCACSSATDPGENTSSSIAVASRQLVSVFMHWSNARRKESRIPCRRSGRSESARTPFDIPQPRTCSIPAWTSTPSEPG
jgi:hypothetical protein